MFRTSSNGQAGRPGSGPLPDGAVAGRQALLLVRLINAAALERALGEAAAANVRAIFASRVREALPTEASVWKAEQGTIALGIAGLGPAASVRLGRQLVSDVTEETVPSPVGPIGLAVVVGAASTAGGGGSRLGAAARAALEEAIRRRVSVVHRDGDQRRHSRRETEERALERLAIRAASGKGLAIAYRAVHRADAPDITAYHQCLPRFDDGTGTVRGGRDISSAVTRLGLTPFFDRAVISEVLLALRREHRSRVSCAVHGISLGDVRIAVEIAARAREAPDVAERLILQIDARDWPAQGEPAEAALERIRELGCAVSLADLRLTSLPLSAVSRRRVDLLALSPVLTAAAPMDPDARLEIRMIREFALHHGLMIVAKEVRTGDEAAALRSLGVDALEGPAAGGSAGVGAKGTMRHDEMGIAEAG